MTNHSKSRTGVLPDIFSPPGGDRGPGNNAELQDLELGNHESRYPTPIDEEQMETLKHAGSSGLPLDVRDWFDGGHHGEDVTCLQATKTSASESSIADGQLNLITESRKQPDIVLAAPSSPNRDTTWDVGANGWMARGFGRLEGEGEPAGIYAVGEIIPSFKQVSARRQT